LKRYILDGKFLREIHIIASLDNDYLLKYRSAWFENGIATKVIIRLVLITLPVFSLIKVFIAFKINNIVLFLSCKDNKNLILYMQMDLCEMDLSKAIKIIRTQLKWTDYISMTLKAQYISTELLQEILLGIQYLHDDTIKNKKIVLHRDLKPSNIFITGGNNGRFVKIADFGLSTFHNESDESHTSRLGTENYIAPEVLDGRKYNTKADMYSLGVIVDKLFFFSQENIDR
jgi:serine/threonine protein kinase